MSREWSSKDANQISRAEHEDHHDAKRVYIVNPEAIGAFPSAGVPARSAGEIPAPSIQKEYVVVKEPEIRIVETIKEIMVQVPTVEYREIEKQVVVKEIQIVEIEKHVMLPGSTEVRIVEVERAPRWMLVALALQAVLVLILSMHR